MSEIEKETVVESVPTEGKKKGGKKIILLAIVAVLLVTGGGVGYYFLRIAGTSKAEAASDKKSKKAAKTEEPAGEEEETKSAKKPEKTESAQIPDDEDVKHVVELPPFIVNLADSEQARYLRMSVSLGIGEGGEKEKPDPLFMTRVRNAMLAVLSQKSSDEILTVEGKTKLRKELLEAAQAASAEPEVHAIYITDFIVQL